MSYQMTLQDSPRYLSGEYDYEVVGGDTIYYHNYPDVSSTNNLGSVTSGNFLARAVPSWVVSAGTSYIAQRERAGTTDPSLVSPPDGAVSTYDATTRQFQMETLDTEQYEFDTTGMDGTVDIGEDIQAKFDEGYREIKFVGGGDVLVSTPVFLDETADQRQGYKISGDGRTTLIVGSGLPTISGFTAYSTIGFAFHNNTLRSALSGNVVTHDDTTRANGYVTTRGRFVVEDLMIESEDQDELTGLVFSNTASVHLDNLSIKYLTIGHAWRGYTDGNTATNIDCRTMEPDTAWLMYGSGLGDCVRVESIESNHGVGILRQYAGRGAHITSCVQGRFAFDDCHGITIDNWHSERGNGDPGLLVDCSEVTVSNSSFMTNAADGYNDIEINDSTSTITANSTLTLFNTKFNHYYYSTDEDLTRPSNIHITAANNGTKIFAYCTNGEIYRYGVVENTASNIIITSDVAGITTALDDAGGRTSSGTGWVLQRMLGAWRVTDVGQMAGYLASQLLTTPSWTYGPVTGGSYAGVGTLVESTEYHYAAVSVDADGNTSLPTADQSFTATSAGTIYAFIGVTPPSTLRLYRKAGSTALVSPTHYCDIPTDRNRIPIFDTGGNVNGNPWLDTDIPAIPTANTTWTRFQSIDGVDRGQYAGSPDTAIAANVGSEAVNTTTGTAFRKYIGTDENGWYPTGAHLIESSIPSSPTRVGTTTSEGDLFRLTVPATLINAGDVLEFTASGIAYNESGGNVNFTYRLYFGASAVFATAYTITRGSGTDVYSWTLRGSIACRTTAAQNIELSHLVVGSATTALGELGAGSTGSLVGVEQTAVNTESGDCDVAWTVQPDTSDAAAYVECNAAYLKRVPA